MNSPSRKSETIRAQLEAFRAILPQKDVQLSPDDFAAELQLEAWNAHEEELLRELNEAETFEQSKSGATQ
jgi:hypothetical protein